MNIAIAIIGFIAAGLIIDRLDRALRAPKRQSLDEKLDTYEQQHRRDVYGAD